MVSTDLLEKTLNTLELILEERAENPGSLGLRDGVIQRFEYCYEISAKTLRRTLKEMSIADFDLETAHYKEILRIAAKKGLIDDPEAWFDYRNSRNKTSHAYDDEVAQEVFEAIPRFLEDAKKLLANLKAVEQD